MKHYCKICGEYKSNGKFSGKALSVAYGDSSPGGRAKGRRMRESQGAPQRSERGSSAY